MLTSRYGISAPPLPPPLQGDRARGRPRSRPATTAPGTAGVKAPKGVEGQPGGSDGSLGILALPSQQGMSGRWKVMQQEGTGDRR